MSKTDSLGWEAKSLHFLCFWGFYSSLIFDCLFRTMSNEFSKVNIDVRLMHGLLIELLSSYKERMIKKQGYSEVLHAIC